MMWRIYLGTMGFITMILFLVLKAGSHVVETGVVESVSFKDKYSYRVTVVVPGCPMVWAGDEVTIQRVK